MTEPLPYAPDDIRDLFALMRDQAEARARAIASVIDHYIHRFPPKQRAIELMAFLDLWNEHQNAWTRRVDAGTAMPLECQLTSLDWLTVDQTLRTLLRDIGCGDA